MAAKFGKIALTLMAAVIATIFMASAACVWSYPLARTTLVGDEALRKLQDVSEQLDWAPMINSGSPGYDTVTCQTEQGFGFTHYVFTSERRNPPRVNDGHVVEWAASTTGAATAYGWPLRCFIADNLKFVPRSSSRPQMGAVATIQELLGKSRPLMLPLAVNVVAFFLAFWFLPGLPRHIRGIYRVMQRRCAACGYPRGTGTVCSECGAPLPPETPRGMNRA